MLPLCPSFVCAVRGVFFFCALVHHFIQIPQFCACACTSYYLIVALCTFGNCFCTGSVSEILLNSIIRLSYVYYTAISSVSDSCALGRLDRARGPFSYCQGPGWCRSPLEHRCGPEDALSSKPRLIPFLH